MSLKAKVAHVELVIIGYRNNIIFDALGDDEVWMSFS
jgi:hypothetical protein